MVEKNIFGTGIYAGMSAPLCLDPCWSTTRALLQVAAPGVREGWTEGGLRTRGLVKRGAPGQPLLSVVTIVFNDAAGIEATLLSVLQQTCNNLEYIVVDGGSQDGTVERLKKHEAALDYWISEPDQGIYDAMNKGLALAAGDFILFMNSGDAFADSTALERVIRVADQDADVLYGDYIVRYEGGGERKGCPRKTGDMWKGALTSHQAMLVRTSRMRARGFDPAFKLTADHEAVSRLLALGCRFQYVPECIAVVSAAGASDTRRAEVYREYARIAAAYFPATPYRVHFRLEAWLDVMKTMIKRILPGMITRRLQVLR